MITEDYVSFETAQLLRYKGFDEGCHSFYDYAQRLQFIESVIYDSELSEEDNECVAPTLQIAMKWLREVYNISVRPRYDEVEDEKEHLHCMWFFDILSMNLYKILVEPEQGYSTYEDCCEAAIKYCLENLV